MVSRQDFQTINCEFTSYNITVLFNARDGFIMSLINFTMIHLKWHRLDNVKSKEVCIRLFFNHL